MSIFRRLGLAVVAVAALGLVARTDSTGRYTLAVPPEHLTGRAVAVLVTRDGFHARGAKIRLSARMKSKDFDLEPERIQLCGPVKVDTVARRLALEAGGATVVDSTRLVRSEEWNALAALAAKVPNVDVSQLSGEAGAAALLRIRSTASPSAASPAAKASPSAGLSRLIGSTARQRRATP
jgi:hypothetical protein